MSHGEPGTAEGRLSSDDGHPGSEALSRIVEYAKSATCPSQSKGLACNCFIEEDRTLKQPGADWGAALAPHVIAVPAARAHGKQYPQPDRPTSRAAD